MSKLTRRALLQKTAGAAAVIAGATLLSSVSALAASAPATAPNVSPDPLVDLKTLTREQWSTVVLMAAVTSRIMTEQEVSSILADSENAILAMDYDTLERRLGTLVGQPLSWADLPHERRNAGVFWAVGFTRASTVPSFEHLHAGLGSWRAKVWPPAVA